MFVLIVFSRKWLWIFMIVSVRMLTVLLKMLMGSELSEVIRLEIWSCSISNCLEREKLMASHLCLR